MATYSVSKVKHATTSANTVDTVTLTSNPDLVAVVNRDNSTPIYVRADGTSPTVEGDDAYVVLPQGFLLLDSTTSPASAKVISAYSAAYSVEAG